MLCGPPRSKQDGRRRHSSGSVYAEPRGSLAIRVSTVRVAPKVFREERFETIDGGRIAFARDPVRNAPHQLQCSGRFRLGEAIGSAVPAKSGLARARRCCRSSRCYRSGRSAISRQNGGGQVPGTAHRRGPQAISGASKIGSIIGAPNGARGRLPATQKTGMSTCRSARFASAAKLSDYDLYR